MRVSDITIEQSRIEYGIVSSMDNDHIFLTPKKILYNLKRIEQALKHDGLNHDGLNLYQPQIIHKLSPLDDKILCAETKSMCEFVGLLNYDTDVKFGMTEKGVAGFIESSNNTTEKAVHITVSENYKNKWKSCIAILAHEICHKVLAVHGLREEDVEANETLVDLATIYVGFGNVILDGYVSDSNNQIIGYLKLDNYKVAHHIVSIVYGKETLQSTGLADVDFLIDEVLEYWTKAKSETDLMNGCFEECESQIAELHRNIMLLEEILSYCKNSVIQEFAKYDNIFFKALEKKDGQYKNKLTALSLLYDMCASENYPKHKDNAFLKKVNDVVSTSIHDLFFQYQNKYGIELKYDFLCPHCGTKMKNDGKIVDRNAILRCPQCKCHYYYIGEKINFSRRQRELKEIREKENALIEERVAKKASAIKNAADMRIADIKRNSQNLINEANRLAIKAEKDAEKEVSKIRRYEQEEYRKKVINRVPYLLRWVVKKYL